MRSTKKCETCGKVAHPTRKEALEALRRLGRKGKGRMNDNVYKCGAYWHHGHTNRMSARQMERNIRLALRRSRA